MQYVMWYCVLPCWEDITYTHFVMSEQLKSIQARRQFIRPARRHKSQRPRLSVSYNKGILFKDIYSYAHKSLTVLTAAYSKCDGRPIVRYCWERSDFLQKYSKAIGSNLLSTGPVHYEHTMIFTPVMDKTRGQVTKKTGGLIYLLFPLYKIRCSMSLIEQALSTDSMISTAVYFAYRNLRNITRFCLEPQQIVSTNNINRRVVLLAIAKTNLSSNEWDSSMKFGRFVL